MKQGTYSLMKTIEKIFKLLELIGEKQPATPNDLAQTLGFSRSNIYRLLNTLTNLGYVERTPDSKYILSFKLFMLGGNVPSLKELASIVRPHMARLAEISQENVNLAIMYERRVLYLDKIESSHYLKLDQPVGKTDPLHCTALGKVLLSGLNEVKLEIFLRSNNLMAFTKNTITDVEVLSGVIRNVRENGCAFDFEELSEGIHCIAAPIRNYTNEIIAAISISGPTVRLTKRKIEELKIPLIETATNISKKMGSTYIGSSNKV